MFLTVFDKKIVRNCTFVKLVRLNLWKNTVNLEKKTYLKVPINSKSSN